MKHICKTVIISTLILSSFPKHAFGQGVNVVDAIPDLTSQDFDIGSYIPSLPQDCQDAFYGGDDLIRNDCSLKDNDENNNITIADEVCTTSCANSITTAYDNVTALCIDRQDLIPDLVIKYLQGSHYKMKYAQGFSCIKDPRDNEYCLLKQLTLLNKEPASFTSLFDMIIYLLSPAEYYSSKDLCEEGNCLSLQEAYLKNSTSIITDYSTTFKQVGTLIISCNVTVNGSGELSSASYSYGAHGFPFSGSLLMMTITFTMITVMIVAFLEEETWVSF